MSEYSSSEGERIPDDTASIAYMRQGISANVILSKTFVEADRQRVNDVLILDDGSGLDRYLNDTALDVPRPKKFEASGLAPRCVCFVFESALPFRRLYHTLLPFNMVLRRRGETREAFLLSNQPIVQGQQPPIIDVREINPIEEEMPKASVDVSEKGEEKGNIGMEEEKDNFVPSPKPEQDLRRSLRLSKKLVEMEKSPYKESKQKVTEKGKKKIESLPNKLSKAKKRSPEEVFLEEMKAGELTRKEVAMNWVEAGKPYQVIERAANTEAAIQYENKEFNTKRLRNRNRLVKLEGVELL